MTFHKRQTAMRPQGVPAMLGLVPALALSPGQLVTHAPLHLEIPGAEAIIYRLYSMIPVVAFFTNRIWAPAALANVFYVIHSPKGRKTKPEIIVPWMIKLDITTNKI